MAKLVKKATLISDTLLNIEVHTHAVRWGVLEITDTDGRMHLISPAIQWRLEAMLETEIKKGDAPPSHWNGQ